MVQIGYADRKKIAEVIDFLIDHDNDCTVDELLSKFKIEFEDYRMICDLALPALRARSDASKYKQSSRAYKGMWLRLKKEREQLEQTLRMAKCYIDGFLDKNMNREVDAENGDGEDTAGND